MIRRISIITLSLLSLCLNIMAQDENENENSSTRDKSVYLELLGPSNMIGVSYDARIKNAKGVGYRIGFGYSYGHDYVDSQNGYSIPIEINYLQGEGKSKLELGAGINLGVYQNKINEYYSAYYGFQDKTTLPDGSTATLTDGNSYTKTTSKNTFGYYFYGNIGYRYISNKGFQFRCGVSPSFNMGGKHGVDKVLLYPYVSFGYAF